MTAPVENPPSQGLTRAKAAERLTRHGPNLIGKSESEGLGKLFLRQVHNPLIYVLLGAAALAVAMAQWVDGFVVLAVAFLNAMIGTAQEYKASRAIEALTQMVPENATVIRDGERIPVPAAEIVPGDLIALASGDKVPADAQLVSVKNLRVEEAALTGESLPVEKNLDPIPPMAALGDRTNMVFGGTLVTSGAALGVVTATGTATELGRISTLLNRTSRLETPLTRSLAKVGKGLTIGIGAVAAALFAVGLVRGYDLMSAALVAITLAVAAIPEGLPAIVTIALAVGVRRMAARKAIVRRLPAVETLGSTTVVCSDKTGTLTRNEMTVRRLWTTGGAYELTGVGYTLEGELKRDGESLSEIPNDVRDLLTGSALCNDASVKDGSITGDPTEAALIVAAGKCGLSVERLSADRPRTDAIPFESERQYMVTMHGDDSPIVYLKGAPEVVLRRMNAEDGQKTHIMLEAERLAGLGLRVLAVVSKPLATRSSKLKETDLEGGFALLGLVGMIDPPRLEAVQAIRECSEAGIVVKMITGDHQGTALAIGREIGIASKNHAVVTGHEIAEMSDEELRLATGRTNVFARVAPEHKLRLVKALQASGNVVAMTGDGVNDAPALKQADIGVAMGVTGTSVSKESADIVLTDDNFATIRSAVEEGRRVYDNLMKSLAFVLPTNLGEALILLVAVLFFPIINGTPLTPVLPVQILWINLVATVALALPLAFEALEKDVMKRAPRDPSEPLMNRFVLGRTVMVAVVITAGAVGLFLNEYRVALAGGLDTSAALREAQTMAVTTVVLMQIFYLLNCRSLKNSARSVGIFANPLVYAGIAALLLLQVAFVHAPWMNALFGSAPLGWASWAKAAAVGAAIVPIVSLEKWVRSRGTARKVASVGR